MKLIIPDLSTISNWLDKMGIESYQCGYCDALHIAYLRNSADIFDAKLDLIDGVISFSIIVEVKPSTVISLQAELSQINASSHFVKIFLDVPDEVYPKMIFRHVLGSSVGIAETQFMLFFTETEKEVLHIINELNSHDVLLSQEDFASYDEVESIRDKNHTYH
ncbi:hypothetical protein PT276_00270 [Orbaceae bacterium ESL0721]|nr:hypothetical protein [Orbaceae bacterium ESL0721]